MAFFLAEDVRLQLTKIVENRLDLYGFEDIQRADTSSISAVQFNAQNSVRLVDRAELALLWDLEDIPASD